MPATSKVTSAAQPVVPLLLARDPVLMGGCALGQLAEAFTSQRRSPFKEEMGAGAIFLLDAAAAWSATSDERELGGNYRAGPYFKAGGGRHRHGVQRSVQKPEGSSTASLFPCRSRSRVRILGVIVVDGRHADDRGSWRLGWCGMPWR
jgi:hypothetical protein